MNGTGQAPIKLTALDEMIASRTLLSGFPPPTGDEWVDFVPPDRIAINHPWLSRHSASTLTHFDNGPGKANTLSTRYEEVYGNPKAPMLFRVGCGTTGYTGIFKILCEKYIDVHGGTFSIGMVRNSSRHSQVALLADIVQLAFTQEKHNEDMAIQEGWCKRVCRIFNDHFILIGPASNPAGLTVGLPLAENLRRMVSHGCDQIYKRRLFHSNGDGSATFFRKQQLWEAAGIDTSNPRWLKSSDLSPVEVIKMMAENNTYFLTDRAPYLQAKDAGLIPRVRTYAEGGAELVIPCAVLLNSEIRSDADRAAMEFATWLSGEEAQKIVRHYGEDWSYGKPLFTVASEDEFEEKKKLVGRL